MRYMPRRNVVRYGLDNALYRIVYVDRDANVSCTGKPLHLVHAHRFDNGASASWFTPKAPR